MRFLHFTVNMLTNSFPLYILVLSRTIQHRFIMDIFSFQNKIYCKSRLTLFQTKFCIEYCKFLQLAHLQHIQREYCRYINMLGTQAFISIVLHEFPNASHNYIFFTKFLLSNTQEKKEKKESLAKLKHYGFLTALPVRCSLHLLF